MIPIPVARPLSLSPNQLVASLETGFFKKAYPLRLMICPKNTGKKELTNAKSLIKLPISINVDPIKMQTRRPLVSITFVDIKFAGR